MLSSEAARLQIHSYKVAAAQGGLPHTRASPLPAPTRRWGQHGRHRGHGGAEHAPQEGSCREVAYAPQRSCYCQARHGTLGRSIACGCGHRELML